MRRSRAVAGGLELALLCDLRVAARSAVMACSAAAGGVPLIDGGTVRLPRIVGAGRALDMILAGRAIGADEALSSGLVNRVVDDGDALAAAIALAGEIAAFPQCCLRTDRVGDGAVGPAAGPCRRTARAGSRLQ